MKQTLQYHNAVSLLRQFFNGIGYIEVPVQSRLSILAACEDPKTVSTFVFDGQSWPLPQTGQMWLEYELLTNPTWVGVYCISTSYRNEPKPIEGRHDKIFPMFEFEGRGYVEDLIAMEKRLLTFLNISYHKQSLRYLDLAKHFDVDELTDDHEKYTYTTFGNALITDFPESTDPFWNMKRNDDGTAKKVDVIINGIETIGSAERETDPDKMRESFHTISDGEYAGLMYRHFGKDRVLKELDEYLSHTMLPRFGAGIGLTRLVRAL